ncbi:predicted protein [Thalassiosira pseudonana CCMP1335]|uniref:LRRK2 ARM repeat domain-containing protein n=1 Tax=Thalassiosira pseudonana TaxID=35128 RepID=B8BVR2_THAPS|nr:predicted protein [Thalassiosira pseudonana CCMP1335]EED95504.1 predicted protein [Thalassiosira pseudonana CCMP1335]
MEFNSSGQVKSVEQIRQDRLRNGYCETCRIDPIQRFEIRRRMGGVIRERVALTRPGRVYNGICLKCHPDQDPDTTTRQSGERTRRHHHHHRRHKRHEDDHQAPRGDNRRDAFENDPWLRASSVPSLSGEGVAVNNQLTRQGAHRDLRSSLPPNAELGLGRMTLGREDSNPDDITSYDDGNGMVKEVVVNCFGEEVVVEKPRRRVERRRMRHSHRAQDEDQNQGRDQWADDRYGSPTIPRREQVRAPSPPPNVTPKRQEYTYSQPRSPVPSRYFDRQQSSSSFEDQKMPSNPSYKREEDMNRNKNLADVTDDEPMDTLAMLIAQHCALNPQATTKFVPGSAAIMPNSELVLDDLEDDPSVLTMPTVFKDDGSLMEKSVPRLQHTGESLSIISEASSREVSRTNRRSVASHEIREPDMRPQDYLQSSAPDIATLREVVSDCIQANSDGGAIDVVTQALIHDNSTSMSVDLALYCLTTLWVLARKSDANKRKIIMEDATFDAIIEAMQIHAESSAEIQTRACGVLWSLSMDENDRKNIAQLGGCQAILHAMLVFMEEESVQVMALGALKVLSFDSTGKGKLRLQDASVVVADSMEKHMNNPTVQSEGCAIICNLAMESNQTVQRVNEKEIAAIVSAILAHPDSLDVHEGACFALMNLASSAANVEVIRKNGNVQLALDFAFQQHPDAVGKDIQTLLSRLRFSTPSLPEDGAAFP